MPRKSNTAERRREIVAALLAVMAERGYDGASIQAIARTAGLAPGLVHYHFENKEAILLDLVASLAQVGRARYEMLAASAASPHARLQAYIDARLATGPGADPAAVAAWVMVGAEAVRQLQVRRAYQDALAPELAMLTELLRDCLEADGRSQARAAQLAASLLAFIEGAFQLSSAARELMPEAYAAQMALQLVQRFIAAEPAA